MSLKKRPMRREIRKLKDWSVNLWEERIKKLKDWFVAFDLMLINGLVFLQEVFLFFFKINIYFSVVLIIYFEYFIYKIKLFIYIIKLMIENYKMIRFHFYKQFKSNKIKINKFG